MVRNQLVTPILPFILVIKVSEGSLSFQPNMDTYLQLAIAKVDEGALTKIHIPDDVYVETQGYEINYHLLQYEGSIDGIREYVSENFSSMEHTETDWIWNKENEVYYFPLQLPGIPMGYISGRQVKNVELLFVVSESGDPGDSSLIRLQTSVIPLKDKSLRPGLAVRLSASKENLRISLRKTLELFSTETGTPLSEWHITDINKHDEKYIAKLSFHNDPGCDIEKFGAIWGKLTGKDSYENSSSKYVRLKKPLSEAAKADDVKINGIKSLYAENCSVVLPPPPLPEKLIKVDATPTAQILKFIPGKLTKLDLSNNGANGYAHYRLTSCKPELQVNKFFKIEGTEMKILLPPGNYIRSFQKSEGNGESAQFFTLTIEADSSVELTYHLYLTEDGRTEVNYSDYGGRHDSYPEHTIEFDYNRQQEGRWSLNTSLQVLQYLQPVTSNDFEWYELRKTLMIFKIPEQETQCDILDNKYEWIEKYGKSYLANRYAITGYKEEMNFQFAECSDCVKCVLPDITTKSPKKTTSTTTTTTTATQTTTTITSRSITSTSTTSTSTTSTSTTSTKKKPKKCKATFKNSNSLVPQDVTVNHMIEISKDDLIMRAFPKLKRKERPNVTITNIEPMMTGISNCNKEKCSLFVTDYAMQTLTKLSGKESNGTVHVMSAQYSGERKECDRNLTIQLEISALPRQFDTCDFQSDQQSHNHKFEIILQKFPPKYTVTDTYNVMSIIQKINADSNMDSIYVTEITRNDTMRHHIFGWGNSTLFDCSRPLTCPQEQVHELTSMLVKKNKKNSWVVQKSFESKFADYDYKLSTVSSRGINGCSKEGGGSTQRSGKSAAAAGVNPATIALIAATIGFIFLVVGFCYLKMKKKHENGGKPVKTKQGVPILMAGEDNRNEKDNLLPIQQQISHQNDEDDSLPAPPEEPSENMNHKNYRPPTIKVTPLAQISPN